MKYLDHAYLYILWYPDEILHALTFALQAVIAMTTTSQRENRSDFIDLVSELHQATWKMSIDSETHQNCRCCGNEKLETKKSDFAQCKDIVRVRQKIVFACLWSIIQTFWIIKAWANTPRISSLYWLMFSNLDFTLWLALLSSLQDISWYRISGFPGAETWEKSSLCHLYRGCLKSPSTALPSKM